MTGFIGCFRCGNPQPLTVEAEVCDLCWKAVGLCGECAAAMPAARAFLVESMEWHLQVRHPRAAAAPKLAPPRNVIPAAAPRLRHARRPPLPARQAIAATEGRRGR